MKKFRSMAFASIFAFVVACGGGGSEEKGESGDSPAPAGGSAASSEVDLPGMAGSFTIPEGAVSVTLFADAGIGIGDLNIDHMTGPDGGEYVDNSLLRTIKLSFPGSSVVRTIPDGDYTPALSGSWNYRFICGSCDPKTKKAFWKSSEGSNLKVNVILVSQPNITSLDAPNLLEIKDHFKYVYSLSGINVSDFNYMIMDSDDTIVSDIDADNNGQPDGMDRLFLKTSRLPLDNRDDYVHIFVVQSIAPSGVVGISGGLPGPPITGTPHSGVIVSSFGGFSFETEAERKVLAETMAHETGHYLGLYHTTEDGGLDFDPISDTPQCHSNDPSPDTCPDGTNLMFWSILETLAQHTLSEGQRFVLRRAHLVW